MWKYHLKEAWKQTRWINLEELQLKMSSFTVFACLKSLAGPFVPRYGHCPILSPLWVSGENKEHHRRAFGVSVCKVYAITADWHRVLKKLRTTAIVFLVLAPKRLPARRITCESRRHL